MASRLGDQAVGLGRRRHGLRSAHRLYAGAPKAGLARAAFDVHRRALRRMAGCHAGGDQAVDVALIRQPSILRLLGVRWRS